MKPIDKLREYVDRQREEYNKHHVSFVWQLSTIADEIEAEIADKQEAIRKRCRAECVHWANEMHKVLDALNGSERFWGACMEYPLDEYTIPPSEIAKEMLSERYMRLPVDADGVPIHVGDEMFGDCPSGKHVSGCVTFIGENRFMLGNVQFYLRGDYMHHVKPRTLEDVIEGAINAAFGNEDSVSNIAKKSADEVREMLGIMLGGEVGRR